MPKREFGKSVALDPKEPSPFLGQLKPVRSEQICSSLSFPLYLYSLDLSISLYCSIAPL